MKPMKLIVSTSCCECETEYEDIEVNYDPLWNAIEWDCSSCGNDCLESNWIDGGFTMLNLELILSREGR